MSVLLLIPVLTLFFICLRHSNNMTGETSGHMIASLIVIMTGDVAVGLAALYQLMSPVAMIATGLLLTGVTLWLVADRRAFLCHHSN